MDPTKRVPPGASDDEPVRAVRPQTTAISLGLLWDVVLRRPACAVAHETNAALPSCRLSGVRILPPIFAYLAPLPYLFVSLR